MYQITLTRACVCRFISLAINKQRIALGVALMARGSIAYTPLAP